MARKPLTQEQKEAAIEHFEKRNAEMPLPGEEKKKIARPYKSPQILFDKMEEYFEKCKRETDWQRVVEDMAELYRQAEEQGDWKGLDKEYTKLVGTINSGDCFPDEAGMRIYLKLSHESYNAYREDPAYHKVFDWAQDMRESWLARRLANEPKMAQAYLNALKQPANGGWVDRRADTGDKTLKLKIDGVGGEAAFQ